MIKEMAQSRKLKKVSMATGILTMGIGIISSMSSFTDSGSGGGGTGTGTEEYDKPKWTKITESITCDDVTVNIGFSQKSDGKFAISADLGKLGKYEGSVEGSGSSHSGSGTIANYVVKFPKDSSGNKIPVQRIVCYPNGTEKCTPTEPCLQVAIAQIRSAIK